MYMEFIPIIAGCAETYIYIYICVTSHKVFSNYKDLSCYKHFSICVLSSPIEVLCMYVCMYVCLVSNVKMLKYLLQETDKMPNTNV